MLGSAQSPQHCILNTGYLIVHRTLEVEKKSQECILSCPLVWCITFLKQKAFVHSKKKMLCFTQLDLLLRETTGSEIAY